MQIVADSGTFDSSSAECDCGFSVFLGVKIGGLENEDYPEYYYPFHRNLRNGPKSGKKEQTNKQIDLYNLISLKKRIKGLYLIFGAKKGKKFTLKNLSSKKSFQVLFSLQYKVKF